VAVVFQVCSQVPEQLLPLSLQVAAAEHHGESTQIPLLAVVAEAAAVAKEQMLSLLVVQEHCWAVVQLQPALHNAQSPLPQELNTKVVALAEPLLLTPRAVAVAAAVGMAAVAAITKAVLVEYRTAVAAGALATSMPHELRY
jgi:hypothetical protein